MKEFYVLEGCFFYFHHAQVAIIECAVDKSKTGQVLLGEIEAVENAIFIISPGQGDLFKISFFEYLVYNVCFLHCTKVGC